MRKKLSALVAVFAVAGLLLPVVASAAVDTDLTQEIQAGTLTYDIVDATGTAIANPTLAFPSTTFSFSCQTKAQTFGTASQKIKVSNPVLSGVKVDINATDPVAGKWADNTKSYKYNDPAGTTAGCTAGQMTVSGGTFTKTAGANDPTYTMPVGAFVYDTGNSTTPAVTLMNNTSTTAWEGELTGYSFSQKIPAEQADGNYTINMTLSAISQ